MNGLRAAWTFLMIVLMLFSEITRIEHSLERKSHGNATRLLLLLLLLASVAVAVAAATAVVAAAADKPIFTR